MHVIVVKYKQYIVHLMDSSLPEHRIHFHN